MTNEQAARILNPDTVLEEYIKLNEEGMDAVKWTELHVEAMRRGAEALQKYGLEQGVWQYNPPFIKEIFRCSVCNFRTDNPMQWCPRCDSRMRKEQT